MSLQRYASAVRNGAATRPAWARSASTSGTGRFTWYVAIRVRQDVRGDVSDLTLADVDSRQGTRVVTLALLGTVKSGPKAGQLRRLTRSELDRHFDELLDAAIRRHGVVPAGAKRNAVRAVYRHKEA